MCSAFRGRLRHVALSSAATAAAVCIASAHPRSRQHWCPPAACASEPAVSARARARAASSLVTNWGDCKKVAKLEANYQTPEVVLQRHEMLSMLGLQPGEQVLDVGCGPGFFMLDMVGAVGERGQVEGVDPSEPMRVLAAGRLTGLLNVDVRDAGAEELPFPDMYFDAVVISQVLLYVPDVPRALAEAHRVLRAGGRVLICDTDWDSLVVHTHDKDRLRRIAEACCSTFVDAHLPPKLPGLLTSAGFQLDQVRTVPMVAAGTAEAPDGGHSFISNWAFQVVPEKAKAFGLPDSEVSSWLEEQRIFNERGDFFACVHRFLFLARKPGS